MFEAVLNGMLLGFYVVFIAMAIAITVNHVFQIRGHRAEEVRKQELHLIEMDLAKAKAQAELKRLG